MELFSGDENELSNGESLLNAIFLKIIFFRPSLKIMVMTFRLALFYIIIICILLMHSDSFSSRIIVFLSARINYLRVIIIQFLEQKLVFIILNTQYKQAL